MEGTADGLAVKIQTILESQEDGVTLGVIANRCRPATKQDVQNILDKLTTVGYVKKEDVISNNNKKTTRYFV